MKKLLSSAVLACALLTACGPILEPQPDTAHYYHLSDTTLPSPAPPAPLPALALSVPRLRIPAYLDRSEIVLRADNRLRIDNNNLWLEPLGQAATRIFSARLARRLGTEKLALAPTLDLYPDALQIHVNLLQFDGPLSGDFVLHAYWNITATADGAPLLSRESHIVIPPPQPSYAAYVDTMTLALDWLAEEIAAQIRQQTIAQP